MVGSSLEETLKSVVSLAGSFARGHSTDDEVRVGSLQVRVQPTGWVLSRGQRTDHVGGVGSAASNCRNCRCTDRAGPVGSLHDALCCCCCCLPPLLAQADAFIFSCCEYNYSISAPLKNAIDWASRSPQPHGFYDKPAAVVSAGGGFGGMKAQMHLHDISLFLNLHIMNNPQLMCKVGGQESGL